MLRAALESQAPPKQNATDTINTLSDRLNNSTLLEDRRTAILGLRSFAREYPATVASTSLRGLISGLSRDVEDIDTGKVVLETLLNLFNPDANSPEASDDIALWLADMFSQRQDNITILLDLLDQPDFYSRLYSLQLLTAISTARPQRTQECILTAPLGTSRLVAVLEDAREPVRSAGLVLLNEVTQASTELQKLVAFEGAFESIFDLIKSEGSLSLGGIVVQDCLSLLANLVHLNPSNQNSFRESGFVPRLGALLDEEQEDDTEEEDPAPRPNKDKNLWGFFAVLRMFLIEGSHGAKENQAAFVRHGLLQRVLDLAFDANVELRIRAEALKTCADIIRGNAPIQESFGSNQVTMHAIANGDGAGRTNGATEAYVIDALLDLTLTAASVSFFDVRFAACEVVQAYFHDHKTIRLHFIDRAIYGFTSGEDETSNILSVLMGGPSSYEGSDPYRIWFAALLAFRLTFEEPEAKSRLRSASEGDAEQGEEVVTCIQSMTGNLIGALQAKEDSRVIVGYLMLLSTWLFEDAESVNDLLAEGSTVQSLVQVVIKPDRSLEVEQGLIAFLLGILYEYSTKDSPIPRRKLQPLLNNALGKDNLTQRVSKLRQSHLLREFEVTPQDLSSAEPGMLPEVFFDQIFVEFFKDNYSRIVRSLDKDPGVETARPLDGIDRDLLDNLRAQIAEKAEAQQKAENEVFEVNQKWEQAQSELRRLEEKSNNERGTMRTINEKLHSDHDAELGSLKISHGKELTKLQEQHKKEQQQAQTKAQQDLKDARTKFDKEMVDLRTKLGKEISDARAKPEKELKDVRNELRDMRTKHELDLRDAKAKSDKELADTRARVEKLEAELKSVKVFRAKSEQELEEARGRLDKELKEIHAKHERALEDAHSSHAQALQDSQGKHQAELMESQAAHEKELGDAKSKHEADFRGSIAKHDNELKAVHAKSEKSTKDVKDSITRELKDKHDQELQVLQIKLEKAEKDSKQAQKGDKELKNVRAKFEKAEKELQEAHKNSKETQELGTKLKKAEKDLADALSKHSKELKDTASTHDKALQAATSKSSDADKQIKAAKDAQSKLEDQLAAARKDAEDAKKKAASASDSTSTASKMQQTELETLRKRITDLETESAASIKTIEQLRTVNGTTLEKVKERDTKIKTLEESKHADVKDNAKKPAVSKDDSDKVKKLEKEVKEQERKAVGLQEALEVMKAAVEEKEESRQGAQTELDDLLLVLGDLEEKRAKDKKKLKELGEKTSDDEEEEDDDEEEEDDEEDEDEDDANGPRDSDVD
ncbi:hypothetical protein FH972_024905 [Carpinus fangiana]|uniref:Vesicle tethering protein Uso1/P115-like head domain-containing protein n=1 Tax=Carpinus fangiana TaxID=176857 RepID=A0A5N6L1Y7_9ROSI|nr:hypothetical protein FH972_024905 [Carpinus fangiana]